MSAERFTASDGYYIERGDLRRPDGALLFNVLKTETAVALIEYGAHKALADRDTALGRWRSVKQPGYVAYDHGDGRARLLRELDGVSYSFTRESSSVRYGETCAELPFLVVAAEFFAAHPVAEPKPWEHAEPGQLWMLIAEGVENEYATILGGRSVAESHLYFVPTRAVTLVKLGLTATVITAGRRIFPEVTS